MSASGTSSEDAAGSRRTPVSSRPDRRRMPSEIANGLARFGAYLSDASRCAQRLAGGGAAVQPALQRGPAAGRSRVFYYTSQRRRVWSSEPPRSLANHRIGADTSLSPGLRRHVSSKNCSGCRTRKRTNDETHLVCSGARRSALPKLMIDRYLTALTLVFTARAPRAKNRNLARGGVEAVSMSGRRQPRAPSEAGRAPSRSEGVGP